MNMEFENFANLQRIVTYLEKIIVILGDMRHDVGEINDRQNEGANGSVDE